MYQRERDEAANEIEWRFPIADIQKICFNNGLDHQDFFPTITPLYYIINIGLKR